MSVFYISKFGKKLLFSLSIACIFSTAVFSETFRVHKTNVAVIPENLGSVSVESGINDAVAVKLPQDRTYLQGIEISFKVPQIVAEWRDSVAWTLYKSVSKTPDSDLIDYDGQKLTTGTFGNSLSLNVKIPLFLDNEIKRDAYSTLLDEVPDSSSGYIFIRLQLAMKGTPDELYTSEFEVTVKPILTDKGKLSLNLLVPSGQEKLEASTVFIDNLPVDMNEREFILSTGLHELSLVSDFYRNELRTFTIDQAKTTKLNVQLRDIAPTVNISAPSGAEVYFDDEKVELSGTPFTVSQGQHTVRFVIGDWETVKTINAVNGNSYNVAITIDASVTEEK